MAFMMPVVKNDWDIYHTQRTRRSSESAPEGRSGRARKISESRSEGPTMSPRCQTPGAGMGAPHRSAPTMRSASYCRAPPSRASRSSLRPSQPDSPCKTASGSPPNRNTIDKFHNRTQSLRLAERPMLYRPRLPSVSERQPLEAPGRRASSEKPPAQSATPDPAQRRRSCGLYCFEFRR